MKKNVAFLLLAFVLTLFTSCRKNHKCTCQYIYAGGDYTTVAAAPSTKRDAQAWCNAIQSSTGQPGVTTACKLD